MKPLLQLSDKGIYCALGDFFIDPWQPVKKALITHAHSDHLKAGHQFYLLHNNGVNIAKYRLNNIGKVEGIGFNQPIAINGVEVTYFPAGHIIGSAQIRVAANNQTWVVSGDYKTEPDGLTTPFEPVKCTHFVTESTFGLPIFRWKAQQHIFQQINNWWLENKAQGKTTILAGYALGKAQRLLSGLNTNIGKIYTHGAIENVVDIFRNSNFQFPDTIRVTPEIAKKDYVGNLVLTTPSSLNSSWMKKFQPYSTGIASGWMNLRGAKRRRSVDRGFVLSDHCDWAQLNDSIKATCAEFIYVTHGYTQIFTKWLNEQGYKAKVLETEFGEVNETEDVE